MKYSAMLTLAASILALFGMPHGSATATDALVEFVVEFCTRERDRLEVAERHTAVGWEDSGRRQQRSVDYSVDGAVPVHDVINQSWRARGTSWRASLRVLKFDYRDPQRTDFSSATMSVSPSNEIDLNRFQDASGIALSAGSGEAGAPLTAPVTQRDSMLYIGRRPIRRPVQHFTILTRAPHDPEIRARHIQDDEFPDGLFSITCSTALSASETASQR